jgi:hypothetical protein
MTMETRRQEQDVQVTRCDLSRLEGRCTRETASFHAEGGVLVFTDPAWLVIRVGLGEEKHFCGWEHLFAWVSLEQAAAVQREQGTEVSSRIGEFASRMRTLASERESRENRIVSAAQTRREEQNRSAAILGAP